MAELRDALRDAIDAGQVGDRLWLYATYHCNLACTYCLTESSPRIADRRTLDREAMVAAVEQARELGIRRVGITGGEPFMLSGFPELLAEIGEMLPTLALTNATLFNERMVERVAAAGRCGRRPPDLPRLRPADPQRRVPRPGQLREGAGRDPQADRSRHPRSDRDDRPGSDARRAPAAVRAAPRPGHLGRRPRRPVGGASAAARRRRTWASSWARPTSCPS